MKKATKNEILYILFSAVLFALIYPLTLEYKWSGSVVSTTYSYTGRWIDIGVMSGFFGLLFPLHTILLSCIKGKRRVCAALIYFLAAVFSLLLIGVVFTLDFRTVYIAAALAFLALFELVFSIVKNNN